MNNQELRILVIGAHPDDCDFKAGGTAALYKQEGHHVKFISVTNGDAGHHEMGGGPLALRRGQEANDASDIIGIDYELLDIHDGELVPSLENRYVIIRNIRLYKPDIIMTHRPNDYHPDHRYTSMLVQDAAYMVTVPNICAQTPHLKKNPVILYLSDGFSKPYPFTPDVVIGIDSVVNKKIDMIHSHTSQIYEWLPYNNGTLESVPENSDDRKEWLSNRLHRHFSSIADKYRNKLIELYGNELGESIQYAEAFESCEYGSSLTDESISTLFPFFKNS
ncbi:GlcNAc-PI de-N-acetylase [Candidatus Poribacteria bacterium]|nr:MAG: GlcNAc-PI de-N-acetylase [Candidatus Poribacteria bacterium]